MKKYLLVILPVAALFVGCLGDTIDGPQVQVRPIFPPGQVYYRAISNTLNLEIRWNPPIVDTQNNFKGYFVELFNSTSDTTDIVDIAIGSLVNSAHVPKSDTMYTFIGKVIQGGRYTVKVWGERVPDHLKPDSMILSLGFAALSFNFDSRPVFAPTMIFASSGGSSIVNLFWSKSSTDSLSGMAGYIIRYKDTTHSNSPLLTYSVRPQKNSSQVGKYYWQTITVPANTAPPLELPFKFWVKAVRKDSVESTDSIGISWSGAELIPPGVIPVKLDTALFLGQVGFGYNMVQVPPTDPNNAYIQVTQSGGNIVLISKKTGIQFVNRVDRADSLNFSKNFFAAPFLNSDFNQSQVSFPSTGAPNEGAMIYALLPGGTRARILFQSSKDSLSGTKGYIRSDNTVLVQASFQPIPALPYF